MDNNHISATWAAETFKKDGTILLNILLHCDSAPIIAWTLAQIPYTII